MRLGLTAGEWIQDLRITCRSLLRSPMLALTIVVTVGLGIGATTAMFAVVDAALLRPLPYAAPGRTRARLHRHAAVPVPVFAGRLPGARRAADDARARRRRTPNEWRRSATARSPSRFAEGSCRGRISICSGSHPRSGADSRRPTASPPVRRPSSSATTSGSSASVRARTRLASRSVWTGWTTPLTGVMPPAVGPLELQPGLLHRGEVGHTAAQGPVFHHHPCARRRTGPRGGSRGAAGDQQADLPALEILLSGRTRDVVHGGPERVTRPRLQADRATVAHRGGTGVVDRVRERVEPARRARDEPAARARGPHRAGRLRPRVIRYLLAESAVLAAGAAAVGIALAALGIGLVQRFGEAFVPRTTEIVLAGRTLWLLIAVTAISIAIFGLVPALHGTGGPVDEGLRSLGRSSTGSARVRRLRQVLVGSQFAVATPLLIVAGLLLGSLDNLRRVDLGFDTRNLLTANIFLPRAEYREVAQQVTFWNELRQRLARLPGVTGVTFVDSRPPEDAGNQNNFTLEASPVGPGQPESVTTWVDGRAGLLSTARPQAAAGPPARGRRRRGRRADGAGGRSRVGAAVLSRAVGDREAAAERRLLDLSVGNRRRRRQRREVRRSRRGGAGDGVFADAAARRRRRLGALALRDAANVRGPGDSAAGGPPDAARARSEPAAVARRHRSRNWWRSRWRCLGRSHC